MDSARWKPAFRVEETKTMTESLRDKSRLNWLNESNSNENIQLGCMLRIADATEAMAKRHTELIDERDRYKRWYEQSNRERLLFERRVAALKGQITKLRNRLAAKEKP